MNRQVTIIVTVYNIEKHLDRFFECLRQQTYTAYEVLIIEDGSEDNSLAVCRRYAKTDDRIRIIEHEHIGISAARNLALREIKTPLVTSLDGDDYFDKDYLKHLVDAQKKYSADWVLSNVIYVEEDGKEYDRFVHRAEGLTPQDGLPALFPALLAESRLNFLYAKLYKAEYLKGIQVERDVRQGSDTMINIQYAARIHSVAVIEDYDYYYVRYRKRSVTSYKGDEYFRRIMRINRFIYDTALENGFLNDAMERAIDERVLHTARNATRRIVETKGSKKTKFKKTLAIFNSEDYAWSYDRQKQAGNTESFDFEVIAPEAAKTFFYRCCSDWRADEKGKKASSLRRKTPDFIFNAWHFIRVKTGTARRK